METLSRIPSLPSIGSSFIHTFPFMIGLFLSYYGISRRFGPARSGPGLTPKQHSWILTTIASLLMTIASLPFMIDYLRTRGSVDYLRMDNAISAQITPHAAIVVNRFFQAYLMSDLLVGSICYREQVALLTGWVHHVLYVGIVELAIRRGWAHIFCLCAFMELPTFLLGSSILLPRLRSNVLFAATFFATRIVLHIRLGLTYLSTPETRIPAGMLAIMLPLHLMWFWGAMKGFIKRRNKSSSPSTVAVAATVHLDNFTAPPTAKPTRRIFSSAPIYLRTIPTRPKLVRQESLERIINVFRMEIWKVEAKARVQEIQVRGRAYGEPIRRAYGALPQREKIYDLVGLGRHPSELKSRPVRAAA